MINYHHNFYLDLFATYSRYVECIIRMCVLLTCFSHPKAFSMFSIYSCCPILGHRIWSLMEFKVVATTLICDASNESEVLHIYIYILSFIYFNVANPCFLTSPNHFYGSFRLPTFFMFSPGSCEGAVSASSHFAAPRPCSGHACHCWATASLRCGAARWTRRPPRVACGTKQPRHPGSDRNKRQTHLAGRWGDCPGMPWKMGGNEDLRGISINKQTKFRFLGVEV